MVAPILNNIYTTCHAAGRTIVDTAGRFVNKTIEVAKKIFTLIGAGLLGFGVGSMLTFCYILLNAPPAMIGYTTNFNFRAAATASLIAGVISGCFTVYMTLTT